MAQMTVAVALGEETPDHWSHHLRRHARRPAAGCATSALARLLCEEGPDCIREMDDWGVGWARKDGHITQAHRARATTGRAASMSISSTPARRCRRRCARVVNTHRRHPPGRRSAASSISCSTTARSPARCALASVERRAGHDRRQGDDRRDRRADAALPPQQRLRQHGRRRLCAGAARRRAADRHGVRAVLPDRPSGAAPDRHGPDHVGPVPLQARRPAAQRRHARNSPPATACSEDGTLRHHPRRRAPTPSSRRSRPAAARRTAAPI